ncbi:MAG: GC-type dockerin domain-anchored protein [Phycisphaerales bacterium]|nr:GC-type dockerin domain-anchored protein [Phycisphaerales bacterium]
MKYGKGLVMKTTCIAALTLLALAGTEAISAERDLQFINILGAGGNVFIVNTHDQELPLDGWRFSTQNSTSGVVHSDPNAFDGIVVPPHGTFLIFFNDNARDDFPTHFNASDIGPFAPFEMDAYSMSFYHPDEQGNVDFSNGDLMVDHIQWRRYILGLELDNESMIAAVDAGLWESEDEYIPVRTDTYIIELTDRDNVELHSPDDYNVIFDCRPDISDDGELNFFDISLFLQAFADQNPMADVSRDGNFNFFDVSLYIQSLGAGCPF